jgi:acetyl-CoA C-acetyltransferase
MTTEAYIYDAIRTPRGRGKADGSLHEVNPAVLLAGLLEEIQDRYDLDTSQVDDVMMGCVGQVGDQGANIAKTAVQLAEWNEIVGGVTMNRFCASGLEAINSAAMNIRSGWVDLMVAGGVESMSRVPMGSDGAAFIMDPNLNAAMQFIPQGISADLIATMEGFSRDDVDQFALRSQKNAAAAREAGYFSKSVVPVKDENGLTILEQDEYIRPDTTLEGLGQLKASFEAMGQMGFDDRALQRYVEVEKINHVHTPGNSSGIVDGAAAVLLANKEKGEALGLKPRARMVAGAVVATEPLIMLVGPGPASKKALGIAGMTIDDIDLIECNEAFAVVPLRFMRDMGLNDMDKINVNGGSIALGHPLGATGACLLGTALDELERRDLGTALITLCVGGGMGIAGIIERVN